jgi:hypothetical protein
MGEPAGGVGDGVVDVGELGWVITAGKPTRHIAAADKRSSAAEGRYPGSGGPSPG